jgi:uncharacterized Zn finger protein (UPF0148 family)
MPVGKVDRKCKECGRTIFRATGDIGMHCREKERIESGEYKAEESDRVKDYLNK